MAQDLSPASPQSPEDIYNYRNLGALRGVALFLIVLLLSFVLAFPFVSTLDQLLRTNLAKNASCPLTYSSISGGAFPPTLSIKELIISGRCLGGGRPLEMSKTEISFKRWALSPFGPKADLELALKNVKLRAEAILGPSEQIIKIPKTAIPAKALGDILGRDYLGGLLELRAMATTTTKGIKKGVLNLSSEALKLNALSVMGLDIPSMNLGPFQALGDLKGPKKLEVKKLSLGDDSTPIQADLSGNIIVNQHSFQSSGLKLEGRFRPSVEFLEKFSLISLMLQGKKQNEEGFYSVSITGTIGNPVPKIL